MKQYEKESLLKNFLVFFLLLEILLVLLFLELYHSKKEEYRKNIYNTMQVCSYTIECPQFVFDFAPKNKKHLNELYEKKDLHAYFTIPESKKFDIKLSYKQKHFNQDIQEIKNTLEVKFSLATILLCFIAVFFTFYSLSPIRKALQLNDEFVKDILHDFNTPITAMVLNIKMFTQEEGNNPFLQRISHSIETILLLQNNFKSFLSHSALQNEIVKIDNVAKQRVAFIQNIYPQQKFTFRQENALIKITNQDLLIRILDNLLSNAGKYNKAKGEVYIEIKKDKLTIKDTGRGMKNVSKVKQRYYKEHARGIGLGLHIVQKLANELNIMIAIHSQKEIGTTVILDFSQLTKAKQ